jgi:hypothetical protein
MDHAEMVEMAREIMRQKPFLKLASLFSPQRVRGFEKIRVGSDCDGGYIMLDDFNDIDLALSFGVETNADWDAVIADRGVAVQQYDYSVDISPIVDERVKFFKTKIVATKETESEASIGSILSESQVTRDASVILKIDIEGDEWPVFERCDPADLARFSQILVEFHSFSLGRDPFWLGRATRVMQKIISKFGVFHVHANNWMQMCVVGNVYFPEILEVSFANRARYQFDDTSELFPTALDQPNNPLRPDLYLGSFKYGPTSMG